MKPRKGQASETLNDRDEIVVMGLLLMGFQQKRIAALFDCNQGRIAEISTKVNRAAARKKGV